MNNGSDTVMVFEGFMDFLSYLSLKTSPSPTIDTVVLNSVTNLQKAIPFLQSHRTVHAFLDNDEAGRKAFARLSESLPSSEVVDQSGFYPNHKDLNEYWQEKSRLVNTVENKTSVPKLANKSRRKRKVQAQSFKHARPTKTLFYKGGKFVFS